MFTSGIELTVGEIADRCALKPPTASEHLRLLCRGAIEWVRDQVRRSSMADMAATTDGATW